MKKILIISFHFAPSDNIAARRWTKMSKYLVRNGHQVEVLCMDRKGDGIYDSQELSKIVIHTLDSCYPKQLKGVPSTFLGKIIYRIVRFYLKLKIKGTIYDQAVFLNNKLNAKVVKLISTFQPDIIISNGPPHRLMYYTVLLKDLHPDIKFVSDFRDPWTWWYNLGYPFLKKSALANENKMEKLVMEKSDKVLVPSNNMKHFLANKYPDSKNKIMRVPHGFDMDDFIEDTPNEKVNSEGIKLVYFGNIYNRMDLSFSKLCDAIASNKAEFVIFTSQREYKSIILEKKLQDKIRFKDVLPLSEIYKIRHQFNGIVFLVHPDFKDYFPSKIWELLKFELPLLLIGAKGELSEYITSNNLGVWLELEASGDRFSKALQDLKEFDMSEAPELISYSFELITKNLMDVL